MKRLSLLPLICYAMMLAYAGYGAAVVGHWPYYAHPDPKELPHRILMQGAVVAMLVGAASVLLGPIGYAIWRAVIWFRQDPVPRHRPWALLFAAGAIIWVLDFLAAIRPRLPWHSVISWLLD